MQTVITWTRYDGTPETLPEEGIEVIVVRGDSVVPASMAIEDTGDSASTWWDLPRGNCARVLIGDLWAPWPEAPKEVDA